MPLRDIKHAEPDQGVPVAILGFRAFSLTSDAVGCPTLRRSACNVQVVDRGGQRLDLKPQVVKPVPERGLVGGGAIVGRGEDRLKSLTHTELVNP